MSSPSTGSVSSSMPMRSTSSRMCSFRRWLQFWLGFIFISAQYQLGYISGSSDFYSVSADPLLWSERWNSKARTLWFCGHQLYYPSTELPSSRCYWHCCLQCRQQECQTWRRARGYSFCKVNICKAGCPSLCASGSHSLLDHSHMTTPGCRKARKCLFRWTIENSCVPVTQEEAYASYPFPLFLSELFPTCLHGSVLQSNQATPSFLVTQPSSIYNNLA